MIEQIIGGIGVAAGYAGVIGDAYTTSLCFKLGAHESTKWIAWLISKIGQVGAAIVIGLIFSAGAACAWYLNPLLAAAMGGVWGYFKIKQSISNYKMYEGLKEHGSG